MTTLFDLAGIRARIFTLPNRPSFMLAADMAEVYGTEYRRVTEAVKRNPDLFPEDFAFYLTPEEAERLPKNSATSQGKRTDLRPLVFTHAGANGLSAIIKSATASKMHVAVHRAFAAMEQAALSEAHFLLLKLRTEETVRKRIRMQIINGMAQGLSFEGIRRLGSYSGPVLAMEVRVCMGMGLIDRLPKGMPLMQPDLFAEG